MPRRYTWLMLAVVLAIGCGSTGGRSPEEIADWAGFTQRDGVEILNAEDYGRLDAAASFTLEGSEAGVNSALSAAGFNEPFDPGIGNVQESLFVEKLDGLASVESAVDEWLNPGGETIHRHVVRGTGDDVVVIRVEAFTT